MFLGMGGGKVLEFFPTAQDFLSSNEDKGDAVLDCQTEGSFIWKRIFILHLYRIFPILISQNF